VLLSTLEYAAYLSYTPRGITDEAKKSKTIMYDIKQDRLVSTPPVPISEFIAKNLKSELNVLPFSDFFGENVSLVPVPKSSLMTPGSLWVPLRIVQAFCRHGLGKELNCLIRTKPVPKAASSRPEDRPRAIDHYQSIEVQTNMTSPVNIILVDDVITRGATLLGAASRLHEAFPDATIRAFAVLRTISNPDEFNKIFLPVKGSITLDPGGQTRRSP